MNNDGKTFGAIVTACLLLLTGGCATTSNELTMTVRNQSRDTIESIQLKPCGAGANKYRAIPGSRIAVHDTQRIVLPEYCVDLRAVDVDGRVAGVQRDLRMLPGAVWNIR